MQKVIENKNMLIKNNSNSIAKKTLFILLLLFSVCCFKLCADDMSPAQAMVAREKFVAEAKKYVGCPYVLGAVGPDKFDCSGLVYYVARESIQKQLPRTAKALYSYCRVVPDSKKEVGDLLFFKTNNSGASVTHVGIYIGNNQFISAISDGPNTGVIISSLNQPYWKPKYVGCGQFIKSAKGKIDESQFSEDEFEKEDDDVTGTVNKKSSSNGSNKDIELSFKNFELKALVFDSALFCDWSLVTPNSFMINWRGLDLQTNVRYTKVPLQPGFGFALRYNHGLGLFQIPILFSVTLNEFARFYAGPVISFGNGNMMGTGEQICPSVFPGILGASLSTPSLKVSKVKIQFVQDLSYTVYNEMDNSALSFSDSIVAGLVLYSGVRVSLGLR